MLILGISSRQSFLKKLNKEINAKQIKFLAQNTDYGPLFPNTNVSSPHYYPDTSAEIDATSCSDIEWKTQPDTDMYCGTSTVDYGNGAVTAHKYCETIDKPFCFKQTVDAAGFGQCGTAAEVPYKTDLLLKPYSRFTLPKHCYCPANKTQEDVDQGTSEILCGRVGSTAGSFEINFCPTWRTYCVKQDPTKNTCETVASNVSEDNISMYHSANFPSTCVWYNSNANKKPWEFYSREDLSDTGSWRARLATIYRIQMAEECKTPNFINLNIMRKDERCGLVDTKNYYCAGYDHHEVYRNSAECAGSLATTNTKCSEVHPENHCIPNHAVEGLNDCQTSICTCKSENPVNASLHTNSWDYDQLSVACHPKTEYIIQYSRVRQWDDYINTIDSTNAALQEEQTRFEETRCPFVRHIIKPIIELPSKPDLCSEVFTLTAELISAASITWVETLGSTVVKFNQQAPKIAANGVCSYSYSVVHTDPTKLVTALGLSSTTMAANCVETGIRSNICTQMGSNLKSNLESSIINLITILEKGVTYSPTQCFDSVGIWPDNDYWSQTYNNVSLMDNEKIALSDEFPHTIGWNYKPETSHNSRNYYATLSGESDNQNYLLNSQTWNNGVYGTFDPPYTRDLTGDFETKTTLIDLQTMNYGGKSSACQCPDGQIVQVAQTVCNDCGSSLGSCVKDSMSSNQFWREILLEGDSRGDTPYNFWGKMGRVGCLQGGLDMYGSHTRFDGETIQQKQSAGLGDDRPLCQVSPAYENKVMYCDNSRTGGYQQCGNITHNDKTFTMNCPFEQHKCCANMGGFNNFASVPTDGDTNYRCSFSCHTEDYHVDGDETFTGSSFVQKFYDQAKKILADAHAATKSPIDHFQATYKMPRYNNGNVFFTSSDFCGTDFTNVANRELFTHLFVETLPYIMFRDLMNYCTEPANAVECNYETITIVQVKKIAMDDYEEDLLSSKHFYNKYHNLQKVCNVLKQKFDDCKTVQSTTITNSDGSVFPILTVEADPTKFDASQREIWRKLNCDHLPTESGSVDQPGYKHHCYNQKWETAKKGAYNKFLENVIDSLKKEHSLSSADFLVKPEVINFKQETMQQYCSVFSQQIYQNLSEFSTTNNTNPFKPSQMTNFIDFCQAKCMHFAGTNPLYGIYSGEAISTSQLRVLGPKPDLYSPISRNTDSASSILMNWATTSQQQTFWSTYPNFERRKVAIKMGIKIRDYLETLQGKIKTWATLSENHCGLQSGLIETATRDYDCFSHSYSVNYNQYPAYRHEDTITPEGQWAQCVGTTRSTRCSCIEPVQNSCTGTATQIETCNLNNWNTIIKPYFMCKMRRRLETVQKVWIYMNHLFFRSHDNGVTIHNRIPSMLKKEMGEKYCQEFCFGFALDHTKHSLNLDENEGWRTGQCFELCTMSFSRIHNVRKIMPDSLFTWKAGTDNSEYDTPDLSGLNQTLDTSLFFYSNHQLWSSNIDYWKDNFADLLRYCRNRYTRDHMMQVINDADIKTKCSNLQVAVSDVNNTEFHNKCLYMDDSNQVWKHCVSWDAPHCVVNEAGTEGTCQLLTGVDVSGDSCTSANCKQEMSLPTSWNSDAELEYCFPPKSLDSENPTQDLVNTCKQRYFISNQTWPNEFWLKKKADDTLEYVFPKEFYDKIEVLDEPWTNPARTWSIGTEPTTGDLWFHESTCPFATQCWVDEVGLNTSPELLTKTRTFVSKEDFALEKPHPSNGAMHVCRYVKMSTDTAPPADVASGLSEDQYYENMYNCRNYGFITISAYIKDDPSNVDYQHMDWPGYNQSVISAIADPVSG